jgi:hypothetical protein
MAFFGALPWHRLGTALEETDLYDWPSASKKAGLDWEVELVPLVTADTQAQVDHRAVRRTSDSRVLGPVEDVSVLLRLQLQRLQGRAGNATGRGRMQPAARPGC